MHVFGYGIETVPALGAAFPAAKYVETEPELAAKAYNASASSKVRLDYTFCDTKNEPARSLTCAKQAASSTGCNGSPCDIALNNVDLSDNLSSPLFQKEGIPLVDVVTNTAAAAANPNAYCISSTTTGIFGGLAYVMKTLGAKKFGMVQAAIPGAQDNINTVMNSSNAQGVSLASSTVVPPTTVSPNAAIDKVMGGGSDGLIYNSVGNVGAALKYAEQTYPHAKLAITVPAITPAFFNGLPASVFEGVGVTAWSQPLTATNVPGIKEFLDQGGLAAGGVLAGTDFPTLSWLGMRFIGQIANTVTGTVDKSSLSKALNSAENVDMGGIVPPWNASDRGKHGAPACSPYHVAVAETLKDKKQVADEPGVFRDATTGKVAYVVPGSKAPAN